MKWKEKQRKAICIFAFLLLGVGGSSVNTLFAQDELEVIYMASHRTEGFVSKSHDINVKQQGVVKQVGDYLIVLRKDTLYSILLNSSSDAPAELVSKVQMPAYFEEGYNSHEAILVTDEFVIVLSEYETDDEAGAEVNFYSLIEGLLEFQERYFLKAPDGGDDNFLHAMTVVDNNLVSIVPVYVDEDAKIDDLKQGKIGKIDVERQSAGDESRQSFDIVQSRQWVNTFSSGDYNLGYTAVIKCPLDNLLDDGLKCDFTGLFGVRGYNYFISPNAVYLSSGYYIASGYGVMASNTDEFLQRTQREINEDSFDDYSAFYRLGLDHNDVTAVLYEGRTLNGYSYEEIGDSFVAILKKDDATEDGNSLYGLHFSLDQFSALPTLLPESDYQLLTSRDGWIAANRFSENQVVLAKSSGGYDDKPSKYELIIWDILDGEVNSVNSGFAIDDFYHQGDNLITVGQNEDDTLALEVWSTGSAEIESLFLQDYKNYELENDFQDPPFLGEGVNKTVWGFPSYRLNDAGQIVKNNSENTIDMAYFELMPNGSIKELGQLISKPQEIDDHCATSCDYWYEEAQPFIVGDFIYALIDNEVIKGAYTPEGLKPLNRFNILSEEATALSED